MRNHEVIPRFLGFLCVFLVSTVFSVQALAQEHGVGVGKACPTATKVGDTAMCTLSVTNEDDFGDTLEVIEFWDVVDPDGNDGGPIRVPATGNLPIIEVGAATCTSVPVDPDLAPIGLDFPCIIDGVVGPDLGGFVRVASVWTVPAGATDPVVDQGNVIVVDGCNLQPIGCSTDPQQQQFGAAVSLFVPSLEASKTGPSIAKVGDEITYTIGFTDTTSGTGFPGFVNCTGNDTLLGDLGSFTAGVPRDFQYTILPDDPDPLPNTVTITCGVEGFDNVVSDSATHNVDVIAPEIDVTKNGPPLAKVGDEITYTIGFTALTDGGFLGECTGSDTLLGDLGVFVSGQPRDFLYTVQGGDADPLPNTAIITCAVEGFDNEVSDFDDHSVDLIAPAIEVTKDGPAQAKVGDEITYTIGFTALADGGFLGECTGSDTLLGDLGVFVSGQPRDFLYTVQGGDADPLPNTATITCAIEGFDNTASDSDDHSVDLLGPEIEVTKDGPAVAKVGDEITYTIGCTALADAEFLGVCTGFDPLIGGDLGVFVCGEPRDFLYTVQGDDPDPLTNTATITCEVLGFDNTASDSDDHSVDLIAPAIEVTKEGPANAKVGDEITYTIGFTALADGGFLGECTGSDTLLGDLGVFVSGQPRDFLYTVLDTDPDPLPNTATITCAVEGFDNTASDSDDHSVDLINPSVELAKVCRPDIINAGDPIFWDITVSNTGDIDLDCVVNDPTANITDVPVTLLPGDSAVLTTSRLTEPSDAPVISNTAMVNCPIPGFDNEVSDEARDDCEVVVLFEICRTPGFWGTHAGTEKRKSTDLAQAVIDYAGGLIMVCGEPITTTDVPDVESSTEAICVAPSGEPKLQLARHLTAAALNCIVSGGGADCTGISIGPDWAAANDVCINGGDYSYWGDIIDEWNNGEECHAIELTESDVFDDGFEKIPGPAGSSNACNAATTNDVTIFD